MGLLSFLIIIIILKSWEHFCTKVFWSQNFCVFVFCVLFCSNVGIKHCSPDLRTNLIPFRYPVIVISWRNNFDWVFKHWSSDFKVPTISRSRVKVKKFHLLFDFNCYPYSHLSLYRSKISQGNLHKKRKINFK